MDQARNLEEIERLNQRGGRALTIGELVSAGTVSEDLAAYLLCAVSGGASFLTAAMPGNAGKTTVLMSLLTFLPPGVRIQTLRDARCLDRAEAEPAPDRCYLLHEVGDAPIYSYLWGEEAVRFLALPRQAAAVASCLHADTLEQMEAILRGRLGLGAEAFRRLGLLVFLHYRPEETGDLRRVSAVYEADPRGGPHRQVYAWDRRTDTHVRLAAPGLPGCEPARLAGAKELVRRLRREAGLPLAAVRRAVVEHLRAQPPPAA